MISIVEEKKLLILSINSWCSKQTARFLLSCGLKDQKQKLIFVDKEFRVLPLPNQLFQMPTGGT